MKFARKTKKKKPNQIEEDEELRAVNTHMK